MTSWKESIKDIAPWNWSKRHGRQDDGHPFSQLQRQMNSLFDDFMSGWGSDTKSFTPKLSVSEDAEKIYVTAELPGMEQKDVELTLTADSLNLRGEKREETERKEGKSVYAMERSYGFFQRSIPLNCEIDTDKVDAVFKNGVLSVTLAKTPAAQAKTKKIPIR